MEKTLNILAPTRYPWRFNGPRNSRHHISNRGFVPLNKISNKIEGLTLFNPFPLKRFDFIHAFNRIPVGKTPFIIGFESHLPRAYGLERTALFETMAKTLAGERCRGIYAISEYARRQFLRQHKGRPWYNDLSSKLHVRYPNFPIQDETDTFGWKNNAPLRLVFIGNHFGRKGGSVAVRLAELALKNQMPVEIDIISALEVGRISWVDPTREGYWDRDFHLLKSLPNVRHYGALPNADVLSKIRQAHFCLLPTLSDSFGYTIIEAMANYTPMIAMMQCALPEFIDDGVNGILLPLETDSAGEWAHINKYDRSTKSYETLFDATVDKLAQQIFGRLKNIINSPALYSPLRSAARATAQKFFSADDANTFWDSLYERVL